MKNCFLLALICFYVASFCTAQTTATFAASADNTIYENPSGNSNAIGQNIFSGTNGSGSPRRGLIRFDVAGAIPSNATITSVTLTLNCNLSRSVTDNVALHKVLSAWGEGTSNAGSVSDGQGAAATTNDATWATRFFPGTTWTIDVGDYNTTSSASVSINSTGFYQWTSSSMIADVQSWLNAPSSNFGWVLICNEGATSTARKFGSRENTVAANRPSLSVSYITALPVVLTYFKATQKNKAIDVSWETSQEINNQYFEVLHSLDGVSFSFIGKIMGGGTTSAKQQYSFSHQIISAGNHFYKLAQIDVDGKRSYSSIQKVFVDANAVNNDKAVAIYPNPAFNNVIISVHESLINTQALLSNANGSVLQKILIAIDKTNLDMQSYPAGLYHIRFANGAIQKLVKQ